MPKTRTKSALPVIINGTMGRRIAGSCPRTTATSGETEPRMMPAKGFRTRVVKISIRLTRGPVIGCGRPSISKDSVREIRITSRVIEFVLLIKGMLYPVLFKKRKKAGFILSKNKLIIKKNFYNIKCGPDFA